MRREDQQPGCYCVQYTHLQKRKRTLYIESDDDMTVKREGISNANGVLPTVTLIINREKRNDLPMAISF